MEDKLSSSMPSTVRFEQRLSSWFLVLGNEDREAFLGGIKILELPCPLDVRGGRESHPFTDALASDFNVAADVAVMMSTKTNPTSCAFSSRIESGPVLLLISASIDMGSCSPVGVGTSPRLRESRSLPPPDDWIDEGSWLAFFAADWHRPIRPIPDLTSARRRRRTPASPSKFRRDDDARREEAPAFFAERSR